MFNIYHHFDVDGGFGDAVSNKTLVATVECTEDEVKAFIEKYDNPEVYDTPYASLYRHHLTYEMVETVSLSDIENDPYGEILW